MSKVCILCNKNPAIVPDRERMGNPVKRICKECHSDRLRGDLIKIMERRKKDEQDLSNR